MWRILAAVALAIAMAGPAVADAYAQMRAQVHRGLIQLGISVPGGVETLSQRQLSEIMLELNQLEPDPARRQRVKLIIASE
jgi:hypothetical protein